MTKIFLWDSACPILIVKAKTGVLYVNQVGGCACFKKIQEGFLIPLTRVDPMEYKSFNHHAWYSESSPAPYDLRKEAPPISDNSMYAIKDLGHFVWWEEVVEEIECLGDRQTGARSLVRMKVKKDLPQYEAWVEVRALIFSKEHDWSNVLKTGTKRSEAKEWVDAILTWQNCD